MPDSQEFKGSLKPDQPGLHGTKEQKHKPFSAYFFPLILLLKYMSTHKKVLQEKFNLSFKNTKEYESYLVLSLDTSQEFLVKSFRNKV